MLRSNICDYSDGYSVAKGKIIVGNTNNVKKEIKS